MSNKRFIVIAGINGAGKTSLYRIIRDRADLGERVNTDEIASRIGDPKDPAVQFKAGIIAAEKIKEYTESGVTFHIETTLPRKTIERYAENALNNGFRTVLYFVGVDDLNIVLDRVHRRIENGGHGIADEYIIKRYGELNDNLKKLIPLFNEAYFFDNTSKFKQIACMRDGKMLDCDADLPCWIIDMFVEDAN